ncbi:MAG: hypothetical protein RIB46_12075 [Pseudomonadales bacterium]
MGNGAIAARPWRSRGAVAAFCGAVLFGCAGAGPEQAGAGSTFDSRRLVYDAVVLDFRQAAATARGVGAEAAGDGAREGAGMMLAAPVGCMQAGMLYGLCLAMAPLFPVLAASRVQDPADSRRELESLAEQIDTADLQRRFAAQVLQRAAAAELPLAESEDGGGRVVRLGVELGTMRLEHSGYRGGSITVTQPYLFTLTGADGQVLTSISGARSRDFDVDEWWADGSVDLETTLTRWIESIAEEGLRDSLIEWQPDVVLAPRYPEPLVRRNVIGIVQERWPCLDSATPVLRWQPLAEALPPDLLEHVTDVSYELDIVESYQPTRRQVTGLMQPEYAVVGPLTPCGRYLWRPRARFRYQGVVHTTSLRTRRWAEGVYVDHHYVLNVPGSDCR